MAKQKEPKYEPNEDYVVTGVYYREKGEVARFVKRLRSASAKWIRAKREHRIYKIIAKFQKKGHEIETFLEKLKNSFVMWVEVNKGRYFNKEEK